MTSESVYTPVPAFNPLYRRKTQFYALHGGRGGGKSWGVADCLLLTGAGRVERILCCREVQKSIKESVKRLLDDRIAALGLGGFYQSLETEIRGANGTLISFAGLQQHTVDSIKSFEGATITWVEEAHSVSRKSLDVLIPTVIRTDNPQIIFTLNPDLPSDPVYADFVATPRDDCTVIQINYTDNPYCPPALRAEAERAKETDLEKYAHVWLGRPKLIADGAIYKAELERMRFDKRICPVPVDPAVPVHTVWDLGVSDSTCIWFVQIVGRETRLVDYYEATGEGLPHYARVLQERGYLYGKHVAPHDIRVRELGSGVSRIETARSLGIRFEIAPNLPVDDGIDAARQLLSSVWIDTRRCQRGIDCLQNYRREFNDKLGEFKATPVHDWASHGADAFRYVAVSRKLLDNVTREPPKLTGGGGVGGI